MKISKGEEYMSKRLHSWSEKIYHSYLREGRGSGDLADYIPWLHTRDFPSSGKVTRIKGVVTGRIHHLLSHLELLCFLYLESLPGIEDIKEQFPLPLCDTQLIAASLKIKHPEVNGFPYVMTTDFYYRRDGLWYAIQIKNISSLENKRVLEKFEIERLYWVREKVDFKIMTEKDLNPHLAHNLIWLRTGECLENLIPDSVFRNEIKLLFLELYQDLSLSFHTIIREIDSQCGFIPGTALQVFKSLIMSHEIKLDLNSKINLHDPRVLSCLNV